MATKFDVFAWDEVNPNEEIHAPKGRLQLRVSTPCPLYITAQGVEALAEWGSSFDLELSEAVTFNVHAPKGTRVFYHRPFPAVTVADGEAFTNIDRMPQESGMLAEVTRARRQMEIERRSMMAEIRAEAAKARASLRPDNLDKGKAKPKEAAAAPVAQDETAEESEASE